MTNMRSDYPTLAEKLASAIADGILDGSLKPGIRLDEISLAQQHGVSRTPVREALRQLATSGFCARAVPPRPRAAAPATLPSRPRRPMVNLSIMLLPPRWCRPEAAWEDGSKRYASRVLRA